MRVTLAWCAFSLGALLCLLNFFLSFIRYPLYRFRGLPLESYRWVSGIPALGSLLVAFSLLGLHDRFAIVVVAVVLIAIDTGGLHWFAAVMIIQWLKGKR